MKTPSKILVSVLMTIVLCVATTSTVSFAAEKKSCKVTGKNCPMNNNKECNCGKDCDCSK